MISNSVNAEQGFQFAAPRYYNYDFYSDHFHALFLYIILANEHIHFSYRQLYLLHIFDDIHNILFYKNDVDGVDL